MTWGELIRKTRLKRKWTQKDLEFYSGVNHSRISRIENGESASEDVWAKLADALDLRYTPSSLSE